MKVDPDVLAVLLDHLPHQLDCPFDQRLEIFAPHHLMDELCDIRWLSLLEVGRQVILLERLPTTSDERRARVRDQDPNSPRARNCFRRFQALNSKLLREEGELVCLSNGISFAIKPDR